jgi:GrpB-like predicted nucleotidyltransferase (UPF0157 family)
MNENTPMTEEELRVTVIGELKPLAGPIVIEEYDPEWPRRFEREERGIRAALGDRALKIEHAGSTSVPGLAAKPIVDIVLVVADTTDEDAYVPALEAAGYVLRIREPHWYEHRMFREPETNAYRVNLHVFSQGCKEVDRMLVFRDQLRRNPTDRDLYERAKRDLAGQDWKYMQNYADAKSAVVAEIMARAAGGERDA